MLLNSEGGLPWELLLRQPLPTHYQVLPTYISGKIPNGRKETINPEPEHSALRELSKHRLICKRNREQQQTSCLCPDPHHQEGTVNCPSACQRTEGLGPRLHQRIQKEQGGILPASPPCLPSSDAYCRHGPHQLINTHRPQPLQVWLSPGYQHTHTSAR